MGGVWLNDLIKLSQNKIFSITWALNLTRNVLNKTFLVKLFDHWLMILCATVSPWKLHNYRGSCRAYIKHGAFKAERRQMFCWRNILSYRRVARIQMKCAIRGHSYPHTISLADRCSFGIFSSTGLCSWDSLSSGGRRPWYSLSNKGRRPCDSFSSASRYVGHAQIVHYFLQL